MSSGFRWVVSPEVLKQGIRDYGAQVMVAVQGIGDHVATESQNEMRTKASWTDRTGNARSGLFSIADRPQRYRVVIVFSHGHAIEYGVQLELAHGGRYAIVSPTMQRKVPEVRRLLNLLFKG